MLTSPCASAPLAPAARTGRETASAASLRAQRRANGMTFMIDLQASGLDGPGVRKRRGALLVMLNADVKKVRSARAASTDGWNYSNSMMRVRQMSIGV